MASTYVDLPISNGSSGVTSLNSLTGALNIVAGSGISVTPAGSNITITNTGSGSGTVTSVAMSVPSFLSVSGSPVTTSGTLAVTLSGTALPILNGGTAVTSVTTSPAATAFAGWDANKNLSANSFIAGYATTATAAGTTTLLVGSAQQQYFTGSTTQTVLLPVVSTLALGQSFMIVNNSSGIVTVQSSGANTLQSMAASSELIATVISTSGTGTASWSWNYFTEIPVNAITALTGDATATGPGSVALTFATVATGATVGSSTSIPTFTFNNKGLVTSASGNAVIAPAGTLTGTTLASNVVTSSLTSVGTIATGVWNGTTIAIANGGTGQTTASAAFNALSPMTTLGDIIYGGSSGTGTRLAIGSATQVLTVASGIPSWATPTTGTVTSVALSAPAEFTVSGSPVTTSGTLTFTKANQNANIVYAGPSSGGAAAPTFRALVTADLPSNPKIRSFGLSIDGGGGVITTGVKSYLVVPYGCTITGWTLLGDVSGSMVIDVWKDTYANYPPTVADTITGADKPTISSSTKGQNLTLSAWTTAVTAGDTIGFNVDSCSTITKATLVIQATVT